MRVLITGSRGFIGRNLKLRLQEAGFNDIFEMTEKSAEDTLAKGAREADIVFHLAGVNRPKNEAEFRTGNVEFTQKLCNTLADTGRPIPVVFSSSIQAQLENVYGLSKRAAEETLLDYGKATGSPVYLFRLVNVFGKWSHNSAVATFCHKILAVRTFTQEYAC